MTACGDRGWRMILGDCREFLPALPSDSVDLVLMDPPYNTGLNDKSGTRLTQFFDDALPANEYHALAAAVTSEAFRVLCPDRAAYVFINWKSLGLWLASLSSAGFRVKNTIVWDKLRHGLNWQNYAYTYELLIFATKGKLRSRNRNDDAFRDIWRIPRHREHSRRAATHHETVKPLELLRLPIEHASRPGELVLDPFAGSGSTGVAARMLERMFLGIERDPTYCQLAKQRIAEAKASPENLAHLRPASVGKYRGEPHFQSQSGRYSKVVVVRRMEGQMVENGVERVLKLQQEFETVRKETIDTLIRTISSAQEQLKQLGHDVAKSPKTDRKSPNRRKPCGRCGATDHDARRHRSEDRAAGKSSA
jgi:DNA modification methylase